MLISIGEKLENPVLSMTLSKAAVDELHDRPGFNEFRDSLEGQQSMRVQVSDDFERYTLNSGSIGRQPLSSHEASLRTFVKLIEWGSMIKDSKPQRAVPSFRLTDIGIDRCINGYLPVLSEVRWPKTRHKVAAALATTAMQSFARQMRYGTYRQAAVFDREVYVAVESIVSPRKQDKDKRYAVVHTTCGLDGINRVYQHNTDHGKYTEIAGKYIGSHKEQLVHLVGAIAFGYADQFAKE